MIYKMSVLNINDSEESMLHENCPGNCKGCVLASKCEMPYKPEFIASNECYWLMQEEKFILANEATKHVYKVNDPVEFVGLTPACVSPKLQPCGLPSSLLASEAIAHTKKYGECNFSWMCADISGGTQVPMRIHLTLIDKHAPNFILARGKVLSQLFFPEVLHIEHISQQLEELFLMLLNASSKSDMTIEDQITFFRQMLIRVVRRANETNTTQVTDVSSTTFLISNTLQQLLIEKEPSEWLIVAFLESVERTLNLPDGELSTSPIFYKLLKTLVYRSSAKSI